MVGARTSFLGLNSRKNGKRGPGEYLSLTKDLKGQIHLRRDSNPNMVFISVLFLDWHRAQPFFSTLCGGGGSQATLPGAAGTCPSKRTGLCSEWGPREPLGCPHRAQRTLPPASAAGSGTGGGAAAQGWGMVKADPWQLGSCQSPPAGLGRRRAGRWAGRGRALLIPRSLPRGSRTTEGLVRICRGWVREAGRGWPGQSCGLGNWVLILLPPLTLAKSLR